MIRNVIGKHRGSVSRNGLGGIARSKGYWTNPIHQRKFLLELQKNLGLKTNSDWSTVSNTTVIKHGGEGLLIRHQNSLYKALVANFPEQATSWNSRQFAEGDRNLFKWEDRNYQRSFLLQIGMEFNIRSKKDWEKVKTEDLLSRGGAGLLNHYNGSLYKALQSLFPEDNWTETDFKKVPTGYWSNPQHQKRFLELVAEELQIKDKAGWQNLKISQVLSKGGRGLLRIFDNSLYKLLANVFPEYHFQPADFLHGLNTSGEFSVNEAKKKWDDSDLRRRFLERLANELELKNLSDWRRVDAKLFISKGGRGFLEHYGRNLPYLLSENVPGYEVPFEEFAKMPNSYWDNIEHQRNFVDRFAKKMNLQNQADWTKISNIDVIKNGGVRWLNLYDDSIYLGLRAAHPEWNWDDTTPKGWNADAVSQSKSQRNLWELLRSHISDLKINYRPPELIYEQSGQAMELDFYSETMKLAIEYQGEQHYSQGFIGTSLGKIQAKDTEKLEACRKLGISLVRIPYWWDGTLGQLVGTIRKIRPDVLSNLEVSAPVSDEKPPFQRKGVLMPELYRNSVDPTGWLVSENVKGVRVSFSGRNFYLVNQKLRAPESFRMHVPAVQLDGILSSKILHPQEIEDIVIDDSIQDWKDISFHVIDAPEREEPFEQRLDFLRNIIDVDNKFVKLISHVTCQGADHLMKIFEENISGGGSGVLLRRPGSRYEYGRSGTLLKLDLRCHDEAVILKEETENETAVVETSFGQRFPLFAKTQGQEKLPMGTAVAYQFLGFTSAKIPRYPCVTSVMPYSWNQYSPYKLSLGNSAGPLPSCRTCRKKLERSDIRLLVKSIFLADAKYWTDSLLISLHICPKRDCIQGLIN
eukprot:TRINITY_DN4029_c0_g1_i1.p1 TRINITY_DN4029_c0_g1~~TRINITY_DN4029_c0_g1_i1.p1  ORF type:complete len:863 (+),score=120.67 TRINITY_DN4029_c0_g1_i1:176-2764(+)